MNGIGLVKLMGKQVTLVGNRHHLSCLVVPVLSCLTFLQAGFLAMHAALSSRIVDICLIPDISFELGGSHGVLEHVVQVVMKKVPSLLSEHV